MKGSKFIFGAFLTIALSVGVGAGLGAQKQTKKAEAANEAGTYYIDVRNSIWGSANINNVKVHLWGGEEGDVWLDPGAGVSVVSISGVSYASFSTADHADATGGQIYCWNFNAEGNKTDDFSFADATVGQNLFVVSYKEGKSSDWNSTQDVAFSTLVLPTMRTVTKLAVEFDGGVAGSPADWGLGSDSVADGDPYSVPVDPAYKNLEHFVGWYEDAACTDELENIASLTANKTIYAKFNKLAEDSYIYWVSESETPVFDHVSFWNEKQGEYELNDFDITGSVKFNGLAQKIYKMAIPSDGDFGFAFYEGDWAKQTYDITPTPGAGYYTWLKDGESKYSWNVNANAGLALDVVYAVAEKMEAVVASGTILAGSVCGIAPADAAKLYNDYLALATHGDAQTMAGNSSINTYDREDSSKTAYVSVSVIMQQLRAIAVKGGQTVNDAYRLANGQATANTSVVVIIAITSVSALALGVFLVLKRKKQD